MHIASSSKSPLPVMRRPALSHRLDELTGADIAKSLATRRIRERYGQLDYNTESKGSPEAVSTVSVPQGVSGNTAETGLASFLGGTPVEDLLFGIRRLLLMEDTLSIRTYAHYSANMT